MSVESANDLHENVVRIDSSAQSWNGVTIVDVHEYTKGEVLHFLLNEEETGIAMALDEVGGVTEPRLKPQQACLLDHRPNHMTLVPRGMPLWGHTTKELHYSRYALLLFDLETLEKTFQEDFHARMFERPRMRFTDHRIHTLVRMLVDIPQEDPAMMLLCDSLTSAVFALLSAEGGEPPAAAARLSDHALSLIVSYIQDQLPRHIELDELSRLAGMSQWHFCRAFKASTGLSPYRWQLDKRVDAAQGLLLRSDAPLDAIAKAVVFCDSMHLSRVFKKLTGEAPGTWRRNRR
ncbi:AraC family transcriptional regulator [Ochrobactrum soli]|uniref:helix-turn-helix domain-containing protein n=1 Tax=Ochrobactrum soli TaxID=2448455 RepID=UPI000EF19574|nr:AraC family transcriptional regulator [[Ochrobactrum] soli]RLL71569.1 AraC family transcriptional regulator [[Ochrobactrum] soli]